MKLTAKQRTVAIRRYARKHGYYARTVRAVRVLFLAALREYEEYLGVAQLVRAAGDKAAN